MASTTMDSTSTGSKVHEQTIRRYHPIAVTLHWLVAILIFATVLFAGEEGEGGMAVPIAGLPPIGIHMILGISTLVLLTIRLVVRWFAKRPMWASAGAPLLDLVGKLTHFGLYLFTYSITITGILLAAQRGLFARVLSSGAATARGFGGRSLHLGGIHGLSWAILLTLILLHVGATLYHQFIKRDNLLSRMWYGG